MRECKSPQWRCVEGPRNNPGPHNVQMRQWMECKRYSSLPGVAKEERMKMNRKAARPPLASIFFYHLQNNLLLIIPLSTPLLLLVFFFFLPTTPLSHPERSRSSNKKNRLRRRRGPFRSSWAPPEEGTCTIDERMVTNGGGGPFVALQSLFRNASPPLTPPSYLWGVGVKINGRLGSGDRKGEGFSGAV